MTTTEQTPKQPAKRYVSSNRGVALLREVLDVLLAERDAELALAQKTGEPTYGGYMHETEVGHWNQGLWGRFDVRDAMNDADYDDESATLITERSREAYGESRDQIKVEVGANGEMCGTAFCFAGHASHLVGDGLISTVYAPSGTKLTPQRLLDIGWGHISIEHVEPIEDRGSGRLIEVRDRAISLLDIDDETADVLFADENNLNELVTMVEKLEAGESICVDRCDECDMPEDDCECISCTNCSDLTSNPWEGNDGSYCSSSCLASSEPDDDDDEDVAPSIETSDADDENGNAV